jgi:flagellar hook-basal body complex protein FliE
MNITPISTGIMPIGGELGQGTRVQAPVSTGGQPTFLDVFKQIAGDAVETQQIKNADMIRLMLGETDNLEEVMLSMRKAEIANDLLVNVRNATLDAYNEITRMQI